ncbi:MAG TPA: transcriptional regulator NrdR [Thermomicrobiales bacterium]|nr:transcriptional regulator NrdR [Thermomicrobiales bacterium]
MKCPFCQGRETRVVDSRDLTSGEAIRRRRECEHCGRRFTTYERVQLGALVVVKKDGRRQEFNPDKLRQKLRIALTKRPVGEKEIDDLVSRVESELLSLGTTEVPASAIGEAVLHHLKELDKVAYIRFASVYRDFADLEDMRREMEELREERTAASAGAARQ